MEVTNSQVLERQFTIKGRVQFVLYRDFAQRSALKLGIVGSVRNEKEGSVFVIAQGTLEKLTAFEVELRKGSFFSKVKTVEMKDVPAATVYKTFVIRYE